MTDRIPLDHLNSDQYDELCDQLEALRQVARGYCPDCGRGDAAPTVDDWEQQKQRADRAETALAEARRLHAQTCPLAQGAARPPAFTCSLCTALTEPARETP